MVTHFGFIVLTLAGSLVRPRCLNTRTIGLVFKQLHRDPANAMKQTCAIVFNLNSFLGTWVKTCNCFSIDLHNSLK